MNVSYLWLASLFPDGAFDDVPAEELARRLTLQGLEVSDVRPAFDSFEGVVVGKVLEAGPHPNADRLTLCTVEDGAGERQVVCGAPNVEVGAIYGYATVGSKLPGGVKIRRAKIRGVDSEGMLCSAPELGLDPLGTAEGIWAVPGLEEDQIGRDLREVLGLNDVVIDLELPSNRGDVLSHLGVGREVSWLIGAECRLPEIDFDSSGTPAEKRSAVTVEDGDGCALYYGRLIDGIAVGDSPAWLQIRLLAVGQRPINNVVDVTNYVMFECGQPLHGFDFERIRGGEIIVRRSDKGEVFITLDEQERVLDDGMTMIADGERAVAIGGVMGGLDSEVADGTTTVFLEGAHFDPGRVGRTSRRLGLPSEAATRFARGVDPGITRYAIDRAAGLIADVAGGTVAPGVVGDSAKPVGKPEIIPLRLERLSQVVGWPIPVEQAKQALEGIGFQVGSSESGLDVKTPSWRYDIEREIDLVEEVARLTGYDQVPEYPLPAPPVSPAMAAGERGRARIEIALRGAGFDEARTPSFVDETVLGPGFSIDNLVEIRNPISKEDRFLRPFVFTTLGRAVAHNLKRGATHVKLFEVGHAFGLSPEGAIVERRALAMAVVGTRGLLDWSSPVEKAYDFFDLRGDIEDTLANATRWEPTFKIGSRSYLHPGRQAEITGPDGTALGFCGELHPRLAEAWEVDGRLYLAECDIEPLLEPAATKELEPIPREPAVERDLALVVSKEVVSAEVVDAVESVGLRHLEGVRVFDRYSGEQVPEGHYSLGLRLTFQADRTLTDSEVDEEISGLVKRLETDHGYRLR